MGRTANHYGRFDTRPRIAAALAGLLGPIDGRVLDLGAGSGVLAGAVVSLSPRAEVVTVDVDPAVRPVLGHPGHIHLTADAAACGFPLLLPGGPASFDLAIGNPPYTAASDRAAAVLDAAGIHDVGAVGLESVFATQMLRLVRPGGRIGLVVSAAFVAGLSNAAFRRALIDRCRIDRVVELPRGSFRGADAQGFLVLMTVGLPSTSIVLSRLGGGPGIVVSDASERWDYGYHACRLGPDKSGSTLADMGAVVTRGILCPGAAKRAGTTCVHITDLAAGCGSIILPGIPPSMPRSGRLHTAVPGDVLVARVGRNLHRSVRLVESGAAVFTDCVFRIRMPAARHASAVGFLMSDAGAKQLKSIARGTGTRYLVRDDLLRMIVPTTAACSKPVESEFFARCHDAFAR